MTILRWREPFFNSFYLLSSAVWSIIFFSRTDPIRPDFLLTGGSELAEKVNKFGLNQLCMIYVKGFLGCVIDVQKGDLLVGWAELW